MSSADAVTTWIGRLKAGDADAAQRLWEHYFARLLTLARGKLRGVSLRAADEEDVAISAFNSFCQAVHRGRFPRLDSRDDLWQVLVMLTARKAFQERRRQQAAKRGGHDSPDGRRAADGPADVELEGLIGTEPTPEYAAAFAEQFERLFGRLTDETLREVARLRLEGYANAEVAARLGVTERTVERKLSVVRGLWEDAAGD